MKILRSVLCFVAALALSPVGIAASPTKEDIQRLREFYDKELTKCFSLPKPQYESCEARVTEQGRKILESSQKNNRPATAKLLYRCNIPALAPATVTATFSIWQLATDQVVWRNSKVPYFAVPTRDETNLFPMRAAGDAAKGNANFTFPNGVAISIAPNGWATTNIDQMHNKNSLYGEVSPKANAGSGKCQRASGNTSRTFSIPH